nr:MAG TPA: hypothetical protein [Siphoviridae sp. ctAeS79]
MHWHKSESIATRRNAGQPEHLEHIQMKRQPIEKKEVCGSEAEHGNCRVLPDHA